MAGLWRLREASGENLSVTSPSRRNPSSKRRAGPLECTLRVKAQAPVANVPHRCERHGTIASRYNLEDLSCLGDRLVLGILADRLVRQQPDRAAAPVAPDPDGPGP